MTLDIASFELIKTLFTWVQSNYAEFAIYAFLSFFAFCWMRANKV